MMLRLLGGRTPNVGGKRESARRTTTTPCARALRAPSSALRRTARRSAASQQANPNAPEQERDEAPRREEEEEEGAGSPSPSQQQQQQQGDRPVIALPGGGIYFYWNAGALIYLKERYDLRECALVGASAGALAIVLAACDVDFRHATRVAYRLAEENNLYERRLALVGIWGRLVREWLEELLPEDAHERCSGWTEVCILEVFPPPFHRRAVSRFESKADLIECLLASAHIPVLLDYKPCASYKGKLCIDGSALKNNYVKNPDPGWDLPSTGGEESLVYFKDRYSEGVIGETMGRPWRSGGGEASGKADEEKGGEKQGQGRLEEQDVYLTYMKDELLDDSFFDFMELKTLEGVMQLIDMGFSYAQREDGRGGFDALPRKKKEEARE